MPAHATNQEPRAKKRKTRLVPVLASLAALLMASGCVSTDPHQENRELAAEFYRTQLEMYQLMQQSFDDLTEEYRNLGLVYRRQGATAEAESADARARLFEARARRMTDYQTLYRQKLEMLSRYPQLAVIPTAPSERQAAAEPVRALPVQQQAQPQAQPQPVPQQPTSIQQQPGRTVPQAAPRQPALPAETRTLTTPPVQPTPAPTTRTVPVPRTGAPVPTR